MFDGFSTGGGGGGGVGGGREICKDAFKIDLLGNRAYIVAKKSEMKRQAMARRIMANRTRQMGLIGLASQCMLVIRLICSVGFWLYTEEHY